MRTTAGRAAWILLAALIGFMPASDVFAKRKKRKASEDDSSAPVRIAPLEDLGEEPPENLGEAVAAPPASVSTTESAPVDAPAATEPVDAQEEPLPAEAPPAEAPPAEAPPAEAPPAEAPPAEAPADVHSDAADSALEESPIEDAVPVDVEDDSEEEPTLSRKARRVAKKAARNAPELGDEEGTIYTPPPPPVDPDAPVYVRSSDGVAYAISQLMPSFEACLAAADQNRQASHARLRVHFEISREGTIGPVKVIGSSGGEIEGCLVLSVATLRFERGPIEQPVQIPIQVRIGS